MGDGRWAMGNGTCEMGDGRWATGHAKSAMGYGLWATITIALCPLPIHVVDQLGITTVLITWMTPLL
jgi:hypothetical protein